MGRKDDEYLMITGCDIENMNENGHFTCRPKMLDSDGSVIESIDNNKEPIKAKFVGSDLKILNSGGATGRMIKAFVDEMESIGRRR